jgi:hypothetical protein
MYTHTEREKDLVQDNRFFHLSTLEAARGIGEWGTTSILPSQFSNSSSPATANRFVITRGGQGERTGTANEDDTGIQISNRRKVQDESQRARRGQCIARAGRGRGHHKREAAVSTRSSQVG